MVAMLLSRTAAIERAGDELAAADGGTELSCSLTAASGQPPLVAEMETPQALPPNEQ